METSKQQLKEIIIKKCLDCCGYNPKEYNKLTEQDLKEADFERENCLATTCPLYDLRLGTNPYKQKRKYNISEEERERRRGNFKL